MTAKHTRTRARAATRRKSVLVVDDEHGTVEVLSAVLNDAGFNAMGAANGRDALAKLAAGRVPDLVLLDYMMPTLDGADTFREMKADPRLASVPVIFMSGIPESMVKRRCRGYAAFLRKPFLLDELLAIVERTLADAQ